MKNMAYSRFFFRITLIVILGLMSWTCDILQPLPDNPYDPLNPDFKEPETRILSGPSGTSTAKEVTIGGKVYGDVDVDKKVTLGDTSALTGNLKATTLTIEEGAKFEGVCNMANNGKPTKKT